MSKGYLSEKKVGTSEYGGELRRGWMHKQIMAFYLMIYDIIAVNFSYFMGLWLRFDLRFTQIPREYLDAFVHFAPVYTLLHCLYLPVCIFIEVFGSSPASMN